MIPRREEEVESTASAPSSPRYSDVSNGSRYMRDNDFLESPMLSPASEVSVWSQGKRPPVHGRLRHMIGIALLLMTVFLWTVSNFLASVG
jgi:solute carrier family 35 protein F5